MSRSKDDASFMDILKDWIKVFLPKTRGVSANTVKSYKYTFRLLLKYLWEKNGIVSDDITFDTLDYDTLVEFLKWLETDRGCSVSTRNQRLAALNSFATYARNKSFDAALTLKTSVSKIPLKKGTSRKRSFFTLEEVAILMNLPSEHTSIGFRDKVLLSFMYATGARAQEICDLKVGSIRFQPDGTAYVSILGKGGKRRNIRIGVKPAGMIKEYLARRKITSRHDAYLFSSQTNSHMSVSCIEMIFKKYLRLAKELHSDKFLNGSYSPHSMRHTTACHMVEAGVPILAIKNFLGHASLQTTEIYAEMMQSSIDKHLKKWNETWFSKIEEPEKKDTADDNIPDFLKL